MAVEVGGEVLIVVTGDGLLAAGESTPHVPGLSIGTQVRPVEKRVHLRLVTLSSSLPQTMLPSFVHWEQPACPVKERLGEHPEGS